MFGLGEKTTLNSIYWLKLFCIQFGGDKSFFTFCLKDPRIGCANECKKSLNECCWRTGDDRGSVRPAQPRHRHQALHQVTRAVIRARGVNTGKVRVSGQWTHALLSTSDCHGQPTPLCPTLPATTSVENQSKSYI